MATDTHLACVSKPDAKAHPLLPFFVGLCILDIKPAPLPAMPRSKRESGVEGEEGRRRGEEEQEEPRDPPDDWDRKADEYLAGMETKPLADAYVVLLKDANEPGTAAYYRTNRKGELLAITTGEIDGPVPTDLKRRQPLEQDRTYSCFWTYDKSLFKQAISYIGSGTCNVFEKYGFFKFSTHGTRFEPDRLRQILPGWSETRDLDRRKLAVLHHNLRDGAGVLFRNEIAQANSREGVPLGAEFRGSAACMYWLYAHRPGIAATHLAEFIAHYAQRVRVESAWEYERMHKALQVITASKEGARLHGLDAEVKQNRFGERYVPWALQCARATGSAPHKYMSAEQFEKTLYGVWDVGTDRWRDAAHEVQRDFKVQHPFFTRPAGEARDPLLGSYEPVHSAKPFVNYFNFYQYGRLSEDPHQPQFHHGWTVVALKAEAQVLGQVKDLLRYGAEHFRWHANCLRVWADIAWHVKDEQVERPQPAGAERRGKDGETEPARKQMHERFLDAAEDVGYDWWEGMPDGAAREAPGREEHERAKEEKRGDEGELNLSEEEDELGKVILAGFETGAKQAEVFNEFFAWRGRTAKERITRSVNQFTRAYRKIKYLDRWIVKSGFTEIGLGDITLEPKLEYRKTGGLNRDGTPKVAVASRGKIVVKQKGTPIGELEFRVVDAKKQVKALEVESFNGVERSGHRGVRREGMEIEEAKHRGWPESLGHRGVHREGMEIEEAKHRGRPESLENLLDERKDRLVKVPMWFSSFFYAVLTGLEILKFKEECKERGTGEVVLSTGVNLGLTVQSLAEATELTFHALAEEKMFFKTASFIKGFGKLGKIAGRAALVVEFVIVGREGMLLVFEEAEFQHEMGRPVRTSLTAGKGCVLLGGAGGGAAVALITGSLATGGAVLAGAMIISAALEVGSWIWGEPANWMDEIDKPLIKALEREFGEHFWEKKKYKICRTSDRLAHVLGSMDDFLKPVEGT